MTKKTRDLLIAIGLLVMGYFLGDIIVKINNNSFGVKIEPEKILENSDVFKDVESNIENNESSQFLDISEKNSALKSGTVKYIIDGDTIILTNGEKVRYIGIDTPERGQCWYRQAKEMNRDLVSGKKVRLEKDQTNRDKYERLLRYIYVDDSFVNLELVKAGLARIKFYKPDTKHHSKLKEAEDYAKLNKVGLWGGCEE